MSEKIQRYEMHTTQVGSHMRRRNDGEWCDSDDVEKLEAELEKANQKIARMAKIAGYLSGGEEAQSAFGAIIEISRES